MNATVSFSKKFLRYLLSKVLFEIYEYSTLLLKPFLILSFKPRLKCAMKWSMAGLTFVYIKMAMTKMLDTLISLACVYLVDIPWHLSFPRVWYPSWWGGLISPNLSCMTGRWDLFFNKPLSVRHVLSFLSQLHPYPESAHVPFTPHAHLYKEVEFAPPQ